MKKIEQKVIEFISWYGLIDSGDKILVAFSGGPDSVFALHFLTKYKKKYNIEVLAVHFNHNLRGRESDRDEKFVRKYCAQNKIQLFVESLNVKQFARSSKKSIEEAARILRYQSLEKIAEAEDCSKIVTAHNQTDNTETVFLNLIFGTGLKGLAGIPARRGKIIRPFMAVTKPEILSYLDKNKISYVIDKSNADPKFRRNLLRNDILKRVREKLNPSLDLALFSSSRLIESFLKVINDRANLLFEKYLRFENKICKIDKALFTDEEPAIAGEVLKKVLRNSFSHDYDFDDFMKIQKLAASQKGTKVNIAGNIVAYSESGFIAIQESSKNNSPEEIILKAGDKFELAGRTVGVEKAGRDEIRFSQGNKIEFISANSPNEVFKLRYWKEGDRFIPLGLKGFKKVSDFLTDSKVPANSRKEVLVLENRNNIVWVVGLRIDNRYKIRNKSKEVYKLWMD